MDSLVIKDDLKIADIQSAFNSHFEHLKIEFYDVKHEEGEGTDPSHTLPGNKTIGEVRKKHNEGELSIHGNTKVSTLEEGFEELFGLHVQVFRLSGDNWLQTTRTDDWTLSEQNKKGHR